MFARCKLCRKIEGGGEDINGDWICTGCASTNDNVIYRGSTMKAEQVRKLTNNILTGSIVAPLIVVLLSGVSYSMLAAAAMSRENNISIVICCLIATVQVIAVSISIEAGRRIDVR